jgi:hypothetical protein
MRDAEASGLPWATASGRAVWERFGKVGVEDFSGPGLIPAGERQRITVKRAPGRYLLCCITQDHEGVPHPAQGMMATLDVTGEDLGNQAEPAADATVKLLGFSLALPQVIQASEQTWKIANAGHQIHEILRGKLAEGKTRHDVIAFRQAPQGAPPDEEARGFQGIDPGGSGWLHLDLEPKSCVATCPIPDLSSETPPYELDMILSFTAP